MVTSNKVPEKKVVKMGEHSSAAVVPQRTLLGEVNEHITCPLCRGYYIDATTIVECLHSFCRSCIIKHLKAKSYCPVCEMMINSAKPNIKLDKALQDIVYKLVPGLFQKEMERRQHFYSSRPGPAASATPEQRGEDTERIIFSPEDVISFSLEYADVTDSDSISSKSSDSNEPPTQTTTRRYLQCPAVVNISHLKKFLCMKFDIDSTQFAIDILYKRVPLPDYYTLMDIAYIYNWKRNEPMRFFYQIIDYVAIRNRIFDINRKGYNETKSSPAPTDDTHASSPVPHIDQGSEASSGTDSPMPEDNILKTSTDLKKNETENVKEPIEKPSLDKSSFTLKKTEDEVEKSQFLNSFELTPKSNCIPKTSPAKPSTPANESMPTKNSSAKNIQPPPKIEEKQTTEILKRKIQMPLNAPELKKLKIELEKTKLSNYVNSPNAASVAGSLPTSSNLNIKASDPKPKVKETELTSKLAQGSSSNVSTPLSLNKEIKQQQGPQGGLSHSTDSSGIKRSVPQHVATSKRKPSDIPPTGHQQPTTPKTISPLKIQVPKIETPIPTTSKPTETQKLPVKKIPDLKPGTPAQNKIPPVNKVRMDLLANNSDPTIDRSKILSQVKTSLSSPSTPSTSGDPLKSLFDSCKINIPSSLSITLTDQKLDSHNPGEVNVDPKKSVVNKNLASASNSLTHKVPSPPVHNYIEILKLPDAESKKLNKTESGTVTKSNSQNKVDTPSATNKPPTKSSESSAKGPIPNLKPIADTKLAKHSANYGGPITFQQTFEQQLQTLNGDKKPKGPKNKAQVPNLVPVPTTPKAFAGNKPSGTFSNKPANINVENKSSTALDLSSPHVQSPSGPPQNFDKAFETMQTIANLAKKQNLPPKMPASMSQNPGFSSMINRPITTGVNSLRLPASNASQMKLDKSSSGSPLNIPRHETHNKNSSVKQGSSNPASTPPNYQMAPHAPPTTAQPSPRQTRSPSSSPKLVIAEDKQTNNTAIESNMNQSNQITSSHLSSAMASKSESPVAGPSKPGLKALKPITSAGKLTPNRQPITPNLKPNPANLTVADYLRPDIMHNTYFMRKQLEMNAAWMKAQRQYDFDLIKNMSNMAHQSQSDFNKDKQQ